MSIMLVIGFRCSGEVATLATACLRCLSVSVLSRRPAPSFTSLRKSFIDKALANGHTLEEEPWAWTGWVEKAAVAPRRVCVSCVCLSPLARAMDNRASAGYRATGKKEREND